MFDSPMYTIAALLPLSGVAAMAYTLYRGEPSHRRTLAAAVSLLVSSLLFGLAHSYGCALGALGMAAFYGVLGAGERGAARRQAEAKPSQDSAPGK